LQGCYIAHPIKSSLVNNINFFIIIHRQLGCPDEAASDEEQAEKILYFYPENTSTNVQLSKINMLEGLIEFTSKFSHEPLETAVMDRLTWGFFEAEKDVWIIIGIGNTPHLDAYTNPEGWQENIGLDSTNGYFNKHRVNADACILTLKRWYSHYFVMHGTIDHKLRCKVMQSTPGWEKIVLVQNTRKKIRKIKQRMLQEKQDLQTLEGSTYTTEVDDNDENPVVERMGIKESFKSINDVQEELLKSKSELDTLEDSLQLLINVDYTPNSVRLAIAKYFRFTLKSSEFTTPSLFNDFTGINWKAVTDNSFFSPLLRIRQAVEKASHRCCTGLTLIHDGRQVLWSDLDSKSTLDLFEMVRIHEAVSMRAKISQLFEEISNGKIQSKFENISPKVTPEVRIYMHTIAFNLKNNI
jgi:First Longin domain of INTU, CCZ1 and HPS4